MKAELVPDNGDRPIPITRDLTVIGRKDYCDVVIDHHSLSKRHAVVVKTDGLLVIRDLATTNGTKVKGQKIRWAALLPDDRITLGGYKMRVYLGPDDAPGPSERADAGRLARQAAAAAPPKAKPRKAEPGFASPSPIAVPTVPSGDEDELEIIEEDDDDSGWQRLMTSRPEGADDMIIELE
jgi:predicted component of type VI protein secretion system